jgi:hypothetical protein
LNPLGLFLCTSTPCIWGILSAWLPSCTPWLRGLFLPGTLCLLACAAVVYARRKGERDEKRAFETPLVDAPPRDSDPPELFLGPRNVYYCKSLSNILPGPR